MSSVIINGKTITIDGNFIIEEQYRHGLRRVCFELCAGVVNHDEMPLDAAKRELLEAERGDKGQISGAAFLL